MNYIGSKNKLLSFLSGTINEVVDGKIDNLTDLFAGTGIVGQHFKREGVEVTSNDLQYYSYILNSHYIVNNLNYSFSSLEIPQNPTSLFESRASTLENYLNSLAGIEGFIFSNYSLGGGSERNYFSDSNAMRCDAIRAKIDEWRVRGAINQAEFHYLVASLLESVDKVANTASVYGAYLKSLKKSAQQPLVFKLLPVINSERQNRAINGDANEVIRSLEGQVLYLDPPYNHRQYSANYHMLETIAKADNPKISGKSGLREYSAQKSLYCQKRGAVEAFEDLIQNARYDYIFLSYNNEGIIPFETIERVLSAKGEYHSVEKRYSRFKADNSREYTSNHTIEYLHCVKCSK